MGCAECKRKDREIAWLRIKHGELSAEEVLARKRKQGREAQARYKAKLKGGTV